MYNIDNLKMYKIGNVLKEDVSNDILSRFRRHVNALEEYEGERRVFLALARKEFNELVKYIAKFVEPLSEKQLIYRTQTKQIAFLDIDGIEVFPDFRIKETIL